jgi:hypothetical protein
VAAPTPPRTRLLLSRRDLLRLGGTLVTYTALPPLAIGCGESELAGALAPSFLTAEERATLAAVCDRILPPDQDPGATDLGAVSYVDRLLSAFDGTDTPMVYAGGPYSDRQPFPDPDGNPSRRFSANDLAQFIPLTRLQELRWRAELFGTAAVPGADVNDALLGPMRGLRDLYREGLARIESAALEQMQRPFTALSEAEQDAVLDIVEPQFPVEARRGATFFDLLIQHTLEGCFALPEYGGNRDGLGWSMVALEGDVHPLGFSVFAAALDDYVERAAHPVSTPNPDEIAPDGTLQPRALSADGERVQMSIMTLATILPVD